MADIMQTIFWCAFSRKKIVDSNFIKFIIKGQIDSDAVLVQGGVSKTHMSS